VQLAMSYSSVNSGGEIPGRPIKIANPIFNVAIKIEID